MEYIKLNSGEKMPIIGTGTNTYGKENNQYKGKLTGDFTSLEDAIDLGYRSVDAAVSYRNEAGVGETLKKSNVPREEFFITSKLPVSDEYVLTKQAVRQTIDNSLKNFHTDYLDLYLIQQSIENIATSKQTWEVVEEYSKNGKLRSIGVSDFDAKLLNEMKNFATIEPALNHIQINLKEPNPELIDLLKNMD